MRNVLITIIFIFMSVVTFAKSQSRTIASQDLLKDKIEEACNIQKSGLVLVKSPEQASVCKLTSSSFNRDQAFDAADNLALTSSKLLKFRIENSKSLSFEDKINIEKIEDKLDRLVAEFRGMGIARLLQ